MKLSTEEKNVPQNFKKKKKKIKGLKLLSSRSFSEERERERERFAQTENTVTFRNKQRVGVKVVINTPRVSTRQTIAAN